MKTKTTQDWEMEIRVAIGIRPKTSTELLYKFDGKTYAWLKRHLARMVEKGMVVEEYENGKRLYRAIVR